jgi:hypothetical protein
MKAARLTMAVAALAAGTLLLTGCEPAGSSGSYSGPTCDPNGFGPLSECDGSEQPDRASTNPANPPAPAGAPPETTRPDREPARSETAPCDESGRDVGGESSWAVADRGSCPDGSGPDGEHDVSPSQKITTWQGYTVTVTWIVVSIEVTGFRECVIALRTAHPDPDDHFSRRITTPQDCKAQRVDAVYRPVDR